MYRKEEMMDVMSKNGYLKAILEKCLKRRSLDAGEKEKLKISVCLPCVRGLSEQISRI